MEVLPLIQHIRPSYRQRHEYAIVATFNADLKFFEQRILSSLRARNVLFLMDEGQYHLFMQRNDSEPGPRYAGMYYQVEPVVVPKGVFHPKFILCLSEKRSRLVIGSGNMGRPGFMANAEIFSVIESDNDQPDEATALVNEACDFLKNLAQGDYLSQAAKDFISNATALQVPAEHQPTSNHTFLHSLHKPILELATDKLGGEQLSVSEIHVLAPFIQGTDLIDNLISKFDSAKVHIYLQNNRTLFDKETIKTLCQRYPQLTIFEVRAPSAKPSSNTEVSSERYIHAKLFGFVTSKSAYSLTGSPNFTRAALSLSGQHGNVETALLTRHSVPDFRRLLKNQFLEIEPVISLDLLKPDTTKGWDTKHHGSPLRLLSAKHRNFYLHIDFSYKSGNHADLYDFEVTLLTQGKENHFAAQLQDASNGHISVKCDPPTSATIVWIKAKRSSDKTSISSERRWLDFPQVADLSESGFTQDDFEQCTEIGGIEGVREALRIASSFDEPDWLIAFLQSWNLEKIFKANQPSPDNPPPGNLGGRGPTPLIQPKDEYLQRGLATLIRPDLEEVLESVVQDYRNKILKWLEERDGESIRMGLQFMLVFDLLNLLLMKGFQTLIVGELVKKKAGLIYPQMQYGHVQSFARDFILQYLYYWEDFLTKGNLALSAIPDKRVPPNIYLFHNSRSAIAYSLAQNIALTIDLEKPVLFNKDIKKLIGSYTKDRCRAYLHSSDSLETLNNILQSYDLVTRDFTHEIKVEQLRKSLQNLFEAR
jgi:hypothetical protein